MAAATEATVRGDGVAGPRRAGRAWLGSWKIRAGAVLAGVFVVMAVVGPALAPYDPAETTTDILLPPSAAHWLGTTGQGQDVLAQVLAGARMSLEVGFLAALISESLAILVGVSAGYLSSGADEVLSLVTNVFLVIPVLPLQILIIAYIGNIGWVMMAAVIGVTHWAHSARKLRAQTLSLRRRDFVESARATGEPRWRIILFEILPNETAIIASGFLFSVLGAIIVQTGLSFLGLGDIATPSWGTTLHWAERGNAFLVGAWWWYVPPGVCLALVGMGLALLNLGIDEVVNPRLRAGTWLRWNQNAITGPRPAPPETAPERTLLEIRGLEVTYSGSGDGAAVHAVRGVDLDVRRGEVLGIAGESGSGKSTLTYAITSLLRPPGRVTAGQVLYHGDETSGCPVDVLELEGEKLRRFRWEQVSVVFQAAMSSLNPILTVRAQLTDTIAAHQPDLSGPARVERARDLLNLVGLDPGRLNAYPFQLSGGQRQRVVIAMALALDPRLVIMDEPTTALDVVVQRSILDQIATLRGKLDCAFIFITHDLSLLLEVADRIAVMYAGKVVELAEAERLRRSPQHPYTAALLRSFPSLYGERRPVTGIPGQPPDMRGVPPGCAYHPRCADAFGDCGLIGPELVTVGKRHQAACLLHQPHAGTAPTLGATEQGR
jgi:peptide/nickel transport system permease protein